MIGIDTNVLVRILVADDPHQTEVAQRLLDRAEDEEALVIVPLVVIVEASWVLRSGYGFSRSQIADAMGHVCSSDQILVERTEIVERALAAYETGRADLADHLARESAQSAGAAALATFDTRAARERGFVSPDPSDWPEGVSLHERAPRYRRRRRPAHVHD